jgi:hypothetical protein
MRINGKTNHGYRFRNTIVGLLADITFVFIYGVVLIINFVKEIKDGSRHKS